MSKPRIVGELVIVAYKAIVGKQDPFVIFRLGETTKKTKTDLRGGQHPTWDDQVNLPVPEKKTLVVVQVYDEDAKRQELISECELDISQVLVDGEADDWYPLHYKGRPAGEIYLELTFYSAVSFFFFLYVHYKI
ncbi:C2 domain-containing protein [Pilaira anomala]|nr:C2 domain-containing protein [Pilaira anomala]